MNEISRDSFWKLEELVANCKLQEFTGELEIEHLRNGKLYKNSKGKWFQSIHNPEIYLADPKLIKKFKLK